MISSIVLIKSRMLNFSALEQEATLCSARVVALVLEELSVGALSTSVKVVVNCSVYSEHVIVDDCRGAFFFPFFEAAILVEALFSFVMAALVACVQGRTQDFISRRGGGILTKKVLRVSPPPNPKTIIHPHHGAGNEGITGKLLKFQANM